MLVAMRILGMGGVLERVLLVVPRIMRSFIAAFGCRCDGFHRRSVEGYRGFGCGMIMGVIIMMVIVFVGMVMIVRMIVVMRVRLVAMIVVAGRLVFVMGRLAMMLGIVDVRVVEVCAVRVSDLGFSL